MIHLVNSLYVFAVAGFFIAGGHNATTRFVGVLMLPLCVWDFGMFIGFHVN